MYLSVSPIYLRSQVCPIHYRPPTTTTEQVTRADMQCSSVQVADFNLSGAYTRRMRPRPSQIPRLFRRRKSDVRMYSEPSPPLGFRLRLPETSSHVLSHTPALCSSHPFTLVDFRTTFVLLHSQETCSLHPSSPTRHSSASPTPTCISTTVVTLTPVVATRIYIVVPTFLTRRVFLEPRCVQPAKPTVSAYTALGNCPDI